MRRKVSLAVGGLVVAMAGLASAQSTQIKPRVMLMVDTSGSMNFHLNDGNSTGGDGSDLFSSNATYVGAGGTFLRSQAATPGYSLYEGFETSGTKTCNPQTGPFDGVNSRMFAAKSAISDVINGSGDIDWGLMRYNGSYCSFSTTFTVTTCKNSTCTGSATCSSNNNTNGFCQCTNDGQCAQGEFCLNPTGGTLAGRCGKDANLCNVSNNLYTGMTDTRSKTACSNKAGDGSSAANGAIPQTYTGGCGTSPGAGNAVCQTPHNCNTNADCGAGGNCLDSGLGVKWCACGTAPGGGTCNAPWSTCGGNNWCLYANNCVGTDGGFVLIDPNAAGFSSNQVLPWINGAEIYTDNGGTGTIDSRITDPELHANGGTPLAGAARAATQWYANIRDGLNGEAADAKIACRPYVLIQLTDGEDSCDSSTGNGPIAAAAGFVGATKPGAKNPNKVYVIGLATTAADVTELNNIAQAGGTGAARFATSKQDIEAALADIVASSVLVEKCNGIDDNCNGQCDENFPGVSVAAGVQTCSGNSQCGAGQTCNGASHCTCTTDTGCVSGYVCSGGVCATCTNPHAASTCDNGQLGQCFATGNFVCSADQLSQVCSTPVCTAKNGATVSSPAAGKMRLSNTSGVVAGNVGQIMFVSGSTKVANNGGFLISAVPNATTVDLTNAGVVVPDASSVTYAIPSTQGKGTTTAAGGNVTITVTSGSTTGLSPGATIFVLGGATAGDNGQFTISNVTATTITYGNAAGVSADTVTWAIDICKGVETCNGLDDDCDGIIDNCGGSTPGSCCTSNCPACAKAPFIETCNNCDDDCDGIIDNHLVDTGLSCGNNVGDCAGGTTQCCSNDPNASACMLDRVNDKIWCKSGNPPYPTATDLCDGTDDNCNGVANDEPPLSCFTDGTNTLPMGKDGVGVCHHGIEQCQTLPLCGTTLPPGCIPGACPGLAGRQDLPQPDAGLRLVPGPDRADARVLRRSRQRLQRLHRRQSAGRVDRHRLLLDRQPRRLRQHRHRHALQARHLEVRAAGRRLHRRHQDLRRLGRQVDRDLQHGRRRLQRPRRRRPRRRRAVHRPGHLHARHLQGGRAVRGQQHAAAVRADRRPGHGDVQRPRRQLQRPDRRQQPAERGQPAARRRRALHGADAAAGQAAVQGGRDRLRRRRHRLPGRRRPDAQPVQRHLQRLHRQREHQRQLPHGLPVLPGQLRRAVRPGRVPLPGRLRVQHEHHRVRRHVGSRRLLRARRLRADQLPGWLQLPARRQRHGRLRRSLPERDLPADLHLQARRVRRRLVPHAGLPRRSGLRRAAGQLVRLPARSVRRRHLRHRPVLPERHLRRHLRRPLPQEPVLLGRYLRARSVRVDPVRRGPGLPDPERRPGLRREPVPVRLQHRPGLLRRPVRRRRVREPALPRRHALLAHARLRGDV